MTTYYSLADAARKIGCDRATTMRHADKLGLERRLGNLRIVTPAELEKLRKSIKKSGRNTE